VRRAHRRFVFDDLDLGARRHRPELGDQGLSAFLRLDGGEAGALQVERGGAALLSLLLFAGRYPPPVAASKEERLAASVNDPLEERR